MRRIVAALLVSLPRRLGRPASTALLPAALISLLLTAGGCRFVAQGPFAGRAAPGDTLVADSAVARDTLVRLDTVAVDSALARTARAAAGGDTLPADTAAVPDSIAARRGAPPDSVRPDSAAADSLPAGGRYTVEELLERGPTYVPYDVSPRLLPGEWLTDLLSDTLAPVVDRHDQLSVEHNAMFWVLVDRNGQARDAVLHSTSSSAAFDEAARVVAERLRFRPAIADGDPVPVWVLKRVSLLMR